ncbi:MAG: ribosome silencing factor [Candidatus Eisenbacteria bacterium]|nr:ribosome silencing factor [Candidatus Eisenbacteria bacterium]
MSEQNGNPGILSAQEAARFAAERMLDRKASHVVVMDLRSITSTADFFVIGGAGSDQQVRAVSDAVIEGLEGRGVRVNHVEGYTDRRWVLIDCFDVVIHVFLDELRDFYGLERLWGDAPAEQFED